MKKILITGSNGLLGQKLITHFIQNENFDVVGISRGQNRLLNISNFTYIDADISKKDLLKKLLKQIKPDIIINCVAMTNVDACEENKTECDAINIDAVKVLSKYCVGSKAKLIQLSTDFVFDGRDGYYFEDDIPNPINYYGLSKLKSEKIVSNSLKDFVIIRTILVYGTTQNTNRGHIVSWVVDKLKNNEIINVVTDQLRMPTLVDDLVKAIDLSIKKDAKGIFHISSNELLSIYEIATIIANEFQLNKSLIKSIKTSQLKQKAKRPLITGFKLNKAENILGFKSKSFKEQLMEYKVNLK
jgi:dTDP-4-dehydrorhamnose reductase